MRVALRSAKDPWDVVGPLTVYRKNTFRNNVGNLVFSQATHRALLTSRTIIESNRFEVSTAEANRLNDEADVFVVPLANAFRPSFADALDKLSAMIEQLTIPVVVVGVGAQAPLNLNPKRLRRIDDLVKRFVSAVLERSATIGVRGEFTYDYLKRLGFSSVDVIGCPSMYMWGDQFAVTPKVSALTATSKLSMGVSPYVTAMGPVLTHHLERYADLTYLPQDHATLGAMVAGRGVDDEQVPQDAPVRLSHPAFVQDKVRFFVDPAPWIDHLRGRDFYVGTRIHGTIVALLAGTPAMVLAHDSRTLELAEFHKIPHQRIIDLPPDVDAAQLYEQLNLAAMHEAHTTGFASYITFLERNGLPHVWEPGESPDGFDQRIAAVRYPAAVHSPQGARKAAQRAARRVFELGQVYSSVRSDQSNGKNRKSRRSRKYPTPAEPPVPGL
jgi:Polysaccharide pyruvyl transferase